MLDPVGVIKGALADIWNDLWAAVCCTLIWYACLLLALPSPLATLGLFYYANRRARGEITDLHDFWAGVKTYWKVAYRWGLLNLFILFFLVGDAYLLGTMGETPAFRFAQGLYVTLTVFWILLQLYTLPFLIEQEKPSISAALRNAAVMIGRNPLFSVVFIALLSAVLLAGALLFMLIFPVGAALVAVAANRAVLNRLALNSQARTG
jgi:hypothetical protein